MKKIIPYGRQTLDEDDIEAVAASLRSERLTQGPLVWGFEQALADYLDVRYAVACSSGTAALHLAYTVIGIGQGHGILTRPNTFTATANAAIFAGARPYFADISPHTYNMDPQAVDMFFSASSANIKAVVPVHFAGYPCDMEEIARIARKNKAVVIEDGCHALGARWTDSKGIERHVGDCSHSLMTVFSFHPVKSITTGEGGAITTNDKAIYDMLRLLRSHGITKNPEDFLLPEHKGEPWYYEMQVLGFNYRITDIQSALGISQLKKLDGFIEKRAGIASLYDEQFAGTDIVRTPLCQGNIRPAHHLYVVRVPFDSLSMDRSALFRFMEQKGVQLQVHYIPVHLQPYYRNRFGFKDGDFPEAEAYYRDALSLPIYPGLSMDDARLVSHLLEGFIKGC
ncbi:MAG: UDP-4-amino-4,6-dideoxy-N-acetyl-beta-L-altrosamine transaminase [Deltaproteobacteria bacterium]|nr:UDP-4-amino-4,6-dideoxy-N-acetyl-beta-L-altrosamine transaminase [Deltaproteobacteria bacterium]